MEEEEAIEEIPSGRRTRKKRKSLQEVFDRISSSSSLGVKVNHCEFTRGIQFKCTRDALSSSSPIVLLVLLVLPPTFSLVAN